MDDALGLNLGSILSDVDICLCLSAFPLRLDLDADLELLVNLLGETELETLLETFVRYYILVSVSRSHGFLSRSRRMAASALILLIPPPNAPLKRSATSPARTALLKMEAGVSAPYPTPSAMENAALTRTFVLLGSSVVVF